MSEVQWQAAGPGPVHRPNWVARQPPPSQCLCRSVQHTLHSQRRTREDDVVTRQAENEHESTVSARLFLAAFRAAAQELSADLMPTWKMSDTQYTKFMAQHVFPATARHLNLQFAPEYSYVDAANRSRRLDGAFFRPKCGTRVQDLLVAIEIENKERTLYEEIEKFDALRSPLCVLFFYSNDTNRDRRICEIQAQVRTWAPASASEFLIMWNKPYQPHPHWRPCLVTPSQTEELPLFTIL